ncbi:YihY/virulence factor BrkB family protein [Bosea sp. (in: a-proteobacteria)]|jgi:membrane protein|uniref:YihY/virulence factor BrkB family protein n=1 Tax=Bosea sp. (in: a-proteobacteria) TaxID=1871050 RepID=UPI001AC11D4F|nr:YihY/virulence factor BrkB family protein [Bosea sp. (in: a-proteobacteria)]MBN9438131.1 YihY/virulence factor BrkB family protein [Bosea sp. (in: a-proteobacteria)]
MSLLSAPAIAFERFIAHDGWAIASHIALSVLMSLFPFLIIVTALGGLFGSQEAADEAAQLLLEAWPREIAEPIAREVRSVLTAVRSDALTLGAVLALYFSSSGVEALRIGLNRAYEAYEWRSWWHTRLESIVYVIGGAFFMLAFSLLVVLGPLIWRGVVGYVPALAPLGFLQAFLRLSAATVVIVLALCVAHKALPARAPHIGAMWPGILMTLAVWLVGGLGFGWYLDSFAGAYVTTYAGLATAMIALVFLYWLAAIFLYGAELNAAIAIVRAPKATPGEAIASL